MTPLFAGRTKARLDIDQPTIVAGHPLELRWSVDGGDQKIREGRLELYYVNQYRKTVDDGEGGSHDKKKHVDIPVDTVVLFTGEPPAGEQRTSITVPPTPASAGKVVEWHVRLVVDRKGHDPVEDRQVLVLAPRESLEAWCTAPLTPATGACDIDIRIEDRAIAAGSSIRGTVEFRPTEAIKAKALRVDLVGRRREHAGADHRETTKVELATKVELLPGQVIQHQFEIPVPADATPSFEAENNSQHWYVEGVVDRRMKVDPTASLEVVVFNAS